MKSIMDHVWFKRSFSLFTMALFVLVTLSVVDFSASEGNAADSSPTGVDDRLQGFYDLKDNPGDQYIEDTSGYAHFGQNLATGDVNGDGNDDLLVQGGYYQTTPKVYVFYGTTHFEPKLTPSNADFTITIRSSYQYYEGFSISAGDVNGDDIDDIIIGEYKQSSYRGEVHVYFGKTTWSKSNTSPDVILRGERGYSSSSYFGMDVWSDDMDGDGIDDIIAVEPYWYEYVNGYEDYNGKSYYMRYNYTGLAFIIWGRSTWPSTLDLNTADPVTDQYVRIKAWMPAAGNSDGTYYSSSYRYARIGYYSGQAIHSGDFNNDDRQDVVFSSYYTRRYTSRSGYTSYGGAAWIIEGRSRAEWMQWSGEYDMLARQGDYMLFASSESSGYWGFNPRLGDVNGDGADDLVISSYRSNSGDGGWRAIYGQNDTTSYKTNFEGTYPYGGYYNIMEDNVAFEVKGPSSASYSAGSTWLDDFDGDGIDDLLLGDYYEYSSTGDYAAGQVVLMYGRATWPSTVSYGAYDAKFLGAYYYGYMGGYWGQTLMSGDFNNDGIADLLMSAFRARTPSYNYYAGAVHMFFSYPPSVEVQDTSILNPDGYDGMTVLPGSGGGTSEMDPIGDGIYTFTTGFNCSWTAGVVDEFRLKLQLKGAFADFSYTIGFGMKNSSFYILENPLDGIIFVPEESSFNRTSLKSVELEISLKFTDAFLSQELFDIVTEVESPYGSDKSVMEDVLHLEKDITFLGSDFVVTRDGNPVKRGQFLPGGSPLDVTGLRVAYIGTDIPPQNEKFFVRILDSYSRIFEDRDSAGRDIVFEIPTSVGSGVYKFNIDLIIAPEYINYMTASAIIPMFYVNLDLDGPEAPTNVRFHADGIDDPESRWDDDTNVLLTWDPAYDTQQGILRYYVDVTGNTRATETYVVEDGYNLEIELPGPGIFTASVYSIDESNNTGKSAMAQIIIDMGNISVQDAMPTYHGGIWYMTTDVNVRFTIVDEISAATGPQIDLSTLEYKVTTEMSEASRDAILWEKVLGYRVIEENAFDDHVEYVIEAAVKVSEGKDNFIWFRVEDDVGNYGMTGTFDPQTMIDMELAFVNTQTNMTEIEKAMYIEEKTEIAHALADSINPAMIWVDMTPLTFSSPTPSSDPREDKRVDATIQVSDLGSFVDASSIQYSVSRNGISNYGGWINIDPIVDDSTILAQTVQPLLFEPGSTNYIRWRAKDVAGNGYKVSDDYPIVIEAEPVNNPPLAIISEPKMNDIFDTKTTDITFSGIDSSDQDEGDELQYTWILADRTIVSTNASFSIDGADLGPGPHVFTLEVSDGEWRSTTSISIYIKLHPDEVDTDGDGEPDGSDLDDDGDGLSDANELELETNPRLKDTDLDGKDDMLDPEPLNPLVVEEEDDSNDVSYYTILSLLIILAVLILLIGSLIVIRRRSTMERERVERSIIAEGKILSRYEELTGVGSPLLPQVKDMGLSLPPISAQNVAPVKKAKELSDTPSLPASEEPAPAPEPAKAEPMQAPTPTPAPEPAPAPEPEEKAPRRVRRKTADQAVAEPGQMPAEAAAGLTETAALPGSEGQSGGPTNTTCDLCGSSIEVPAGVSQVECPLCGEKKSL